LMKTRAMTGSPLVPDHKNRDRWQGIPIHRRRSSDFEIWAVRVQPVTQDVPQERSYVALTDRGVLIGPAIVRRFRGLSVQSASNLPPTGLKVVRPNR
jgi:hypothetical protein